jgi:heat shock protein HslJ
MHSKCRHLKWLVIALSLAGCEAEGSLELMNDSSVDEGTSEPDEADQALVAALSGQNFRLAAVSVNGESQPVVHGLGEAGLTFGLDAKSFSAHTGTNRLTQIEGAGFQVVNRKLRIDGKLVTTGALVGGVDAAAAANQEVWLGNVLEGQIALVGTSLLLHTPHIQAVFVAHTAEKAPNVALVETLWSVHSYMSHSGLETVRVGSPKLSPFERLPPRIQFRGTEVSGSWEAIDSCNTGSGTYTITGSTLTFADVTVTDVDCNSPAEASAAERFYRVVNANQSTSISRSHHGLRLDNGTDAIVFESSPF